MCISCYLCVVYNGGGLFALSWLLTIKKKAHSPFCEMTYFHIGSKTTKVSSWDDFEIIKSHLLNIILAWTSLSGTGCCYVNEKL